MGNVTMHPQFLSPLVILKSPLYTPTDQSAFLGSVWGMISFLALLRQCLDP